MARNRTSLLLAFISLTISISAEGIRVDGFAPALEQAKRDQKPLLVFTHGRSWHRASGLFADLVWAKPEFAAGLGQDAVLTTVEVRQMLSEEEAKAEEEALKGWDRKAVKSFPALQLYSHDGKLLTTLQGREFRAINSPQELAALVDPLLEKVAKRKELLAAADAAREKGEATAELDALCQLPELALALDESVIPRLKELDPDDERGWQARLAFQDWDFIREITGLINDNKTDEALARIEAMLASPAYTSGQQLMILGAKGRALIAQGDLKQAWEVFEEIKGRDPDGPVGQALFNYGKREAGDKLAESNQ